MQTAILFNNVMMVLWGDSLEDYGVEAKALASYVKSHQRINPEDAHDVLNILWPESKVAARLPDIESRHDDPSTVIYDIILPDGSKALMVSRQGIVSELEYIG